MERTASLTLPRRSRGRQTAAAEARYQEDLSAFCDAIRQISTRLDFRVSSQTFKFAALASRVTISLQFT